MRNLQRKNTINHITFNISKKSSLKSKTTIIPDRKSIKINDI